MLALNQCSTFSLFGLTFHKLPHRFQFYLSKWSCLCTVFPCLHVSSFSLPQWLHALRLCCLSAQVHDACSFSSFSNFCYSVLLLPSHVCILYASGACALTCLLPGQVCTIHDETSVLPKSSFTSNLTLSWIRIHLNGVLLGFLWNKFVFHNTFNTQWSLSKQESFQNCRHFSSNANFLHQDCVPYNQHESNNTALSIFDTLKSYTMQSWTKNSWGFLNWASSSMFEWDWFHDMSEWGLISTCKWGCHYHIPYTSLILVFNQHITCVSVWVLLQSISVLHW